MSLKLPYTVKSADFDAALVAKDAVWRIDSVVGNKVRMSLNVGIYKDDSMQKIIGGRSFDFTPSVADGALNIFAQGYSHLKTLTEFANAQDC